MAEEFAVSEVVAIGIQIEVNGRDFYSTIVGKAKNRKAGDMFKFLADEEGRHIEKFRQILDSIEKYEPKEAYPEEYFSYLSSLASDYVFTEKDKGKEIANKIKSIEEAIDLGIDAEEKSIIFYEGMKRIVPSENAKVVDELIWQEKGHLKQLLELKKGG